MYKKITYYIVIFLKFYLGFKFNFALFILNEFYSKLDILSNPFNANIKVNKLSSPNLLLFLNLFPLFNKFFKIIIRII